MSPSAGWFPDPADDAQLRWWDGQAWTEHRMPRHETVTGGVDLTKTPRTGTGAGAADGGEGAPAAVGWSGQGGYASVPMTTSGDPLGNQGLRLLARVLDWLLLGAVQWIVLTPLRGPYIEAAERYQESVRVGTPDPFGFLGDPAYLRYLVGVVAFALIVGGLYEVLLLRYRGATLGKMVCGLRVVTIEGAPLGWGRAVGRWAAFWPLTNITCGLWLLLDGAWCLWDRERQCLHDKMADTVVVSTRR